MRPLAAIKTATPFLVLGLAFLSLDAHAAIDNAGLLDSVLARYSTAASAWASAITSAATWLFWTLVVISMVWTFGIMALRKADIGEFFAEFVKFTIFTGFFWWLLTNGPNFAKSIMDGLRQVGSNATGLTSTLSPSGIVDIGFAIFNKVLAASSMWAPVDSAIGIILAVIVLVILALVGVSMLLLLVSGWILAYAGVFFLGFGGARWTSDMAINYYKTVLGVAAQLFTMVLLVGIGKTFLDDYYSRMSAGVEFSEMGVMLIVSVVLLMLVNKVPALISGISTGASVGHAGIGNFGAGAAVGAAGMAAAAAATGGAMLAASAANAAGGAQALTAAFSKASENVNPVPMCSPVFGAAVAAGARARKTRVLRRSLMRPALRPPAPVRQRRPDGRVGTPRANTRRSSTKLKERRAKPRTAQDPAATGKPKAASNKARGPDVLGGKSGADRRGCSRELGERHGAGGERRDG